MNRLSVERQEREGRAPVRLEDQENLALELDVGFDKLRKFRGLLIDLESIALVEILEQAYYRPY